MKVHGTAAKLCEFLPHRIHNGLLLAERARRWVAPSKGLAGHLERHAGERVAHALQVDLDFFFGAFYRFLEEVEVHGRLGLPCMVTYE